MIAVRVVAVGPKAASPMLFGEKEKNRLEQNRTGCNIVKFNTVLAASRTGSFAQSNVSQNAPRLLPRVRYLRAAGDGR